MELNLKKINLSLLIRSKLITVRTAVLGEQLNCGWRYYRKSCEVFACLYIFEEKVGTAGKSDIN